MPLCWLGLVIRTLHNIVIHAPAIVMTALIAVPGGAAVQAAVEGVPQSPAAIIQTVQDAQHSVGSAPASVVSAVSGVSVTPVLSVRNSVTGMARGIVGPAVCAAGAAAGSATTAIGATANHAVPAVLPNC
ncbi:MAG: hypothetical protein ACRDJM_06825 [Actinomycetota bacterium]